MIKLKLRFISVFFIFLLLGVKITRVFTAFKNESVIILNQELQASAPEGDQPKLPEKHDEHKEDSKKAQDHPDHSPEPVAKASSPFDLLDRPASEIEVLQNLLEVKNEIDKEKKLIQQEKRLLQISHEQLDKKLEELKALHTSLKDLFAKYNDQKKENFKDTAKIYDTMPPEKAAAILTGLEDVKLVGLISMMKKSAAVIAAMPSEKAKHITDLLLERVKIAPAKP